MATSGTDRNASQSLRRALRILELLASPESVSRPYTGMSIARLAEELDTAKSTVSRLIGPMVDQRLVVRDPQTHRYRLGDGTLWLGERYLEGLDLRTVAVPFLVELQEQTESTCHLVIREGLEVVYIDKLEDRSAVRMASRIGSRLPMYRTAVGKAIMAFSPPSLLDEVIAAGMEPITERTITTGDRLKAEVELARRRGFAVDDRENEPQVRCVAAAILDHRDRPIGAVSISSLVSQTSARVARAYGELVSIATLKISVEMGSNRARTTLERIQERQATTAEAVAEA